MPTYLITESQLRVISNNEMINEATGWNTFFDIVGIVDPTGIVDFGNGISYFYQGDKLFGVLSMVSAIPYLGDLMAKPVLLGGKVTKIGLQAIGVAADAGRASEVARLANKAGGPTRAFVKGSTEWGPKLIETLQQGQKIPLIGRLFKRIENYVSIFTEAAKSMKGTAKASKGLLPSSAFRNFGIDTSKNILSRAFQRGGFIKNRKLSVLFAKSKFWMKFLDWVGVGNFIGPEEFEQMYGPEYTQQAIDSYSSTSEGNSLYKSELANKDMSQNKIDQSNLTDLLKIIMST